ncbi:hypothetical protein CLIB1423_01S12486 [[Candida] railenensis]|uniref:Ubiquitin-conjugating enzyme E2-binding protein n=1 Tax=[Candida] railenensis TaxID=45579 RepID=A0A9P0QL35_9ASCO|nr:hypothetical protein CLIB1423_01S12486 [[Candida] railenensis]
MYLAEYFPRLDSVSISVDNTNPGASINFNRSGAIASIDDVAIPLPIHHKSNEIQLIGCKQNVENNNLSVKLKVSPSPESQDDSAASFMNYSVPSLSNMSFIQKWSVQDLKNKTSQDKVSKKNEFVFSCKNCKKKVIDSETNSFFDMPSELWSEMMEFWHCHKPNENLQDLKERPYYQGIIKPGKKSEVIVGNYYVLIRIDAGEESAVTFLDDKCICSSCNHGMGQYLEDISTSGSEMYYRINKWELELQYNDKFEMGKCIESYQPYLYVYNMMMDKINSVAIRKFYINNSLFVWVVNVGMSISTGGQVYYNTLKLATRELSVDSSNDELDENNVEVLDLPETVLAEFRKVLEDMYQNLPLVNRKMVLKNGNKEFIEYEVSYLPSN